MNGRFSIDSHLRSIELEWRVVVRYFNNHRHSIENLNLLFIINLKSIEFYTVGGPNLYRTVSVPYH